MSQTWWSITAITKARAKVVRVPVMWVRVPGVCAPELMAFSLEALKVAPKTPMVAASPPVIWFQSPSPWTGPSLISKVELPVLSLVAPSKPLNNPLVSNEATASPVGPDGQKLWFFMAPPWSALILQRTICLAP